jgi:hypothetical protein
MQKEKIIPAKSLNGRMGDSIGPERAAPRFTIYCILRVRSFDRRRHPPQAIAREARQHLFEDDQARPARRAAFDLGSALNSINVRRNQNRRTFFPV